MEKLVINDDIAMMLSDFYQILSDKTRMKIVYALTQQELCVQQISDVVNMSQTAVSYQLRILRAARLVKYKRVGKNILYSIDDDHVSNIIELTIKHLSHE